MFLDVAELAAPSIVEACLAHTTHSFEAAGVKFSSRAPRRPATTRCAISTRDLAPVAVLRGENSHTPGQTEVCPGRDLRVNAGDWTAMTAPPTSWPPAAPEPLDRRGHAHPGVSCAVSSTPHAPCKTTSTRPFYPTMIALLILVVGSTTLLHFSYQPQFKLTWVDAFYFTAETITTTGYGDFSFTGQSIWLRLFAAMLMFGGVFNIALLVAFIADVLLSRRFVYSVGRPRVRHLRNHIIVVGLSALGTRVVTDLTALGYDVAVIELDQDNRFLSSVAELDVPVIFGDATLRQTLESAHVDRARAVAVLTRNEVVNIETGIVLAKMVGRRLTPEVIRPEIPLVLRVYDRASARRWPNSSASSTFAPPSNWPHPGLSAPRSVWTCSGRFRSARAPLWPAKCAWNPAASSTGCGCSTCPPKPVSSPSPSRTRRSTCTRAATRSCRPTTPCISSAPTGNCWKRCGKGNFPKDQVPAISHHAKTQTSTRVGKQTEQRECSIAPHQWWTHADRVGSAGLPAKERLSKCRNGNGAGGARLSERCVARQRASGSPSD